MPNEKKPIPFILLDSSVLTYGVRVLVDGVDIDQFVKNPVMFYRHNDYDLPVGKWENIRKENGQLLADAAFDYEDDDKEVQRLIGKVERGFVKMASAGLVELTAASDAVYQIDGQDGPTVIKCRIREASIVPIGANHNAFRLYDNDGKELDLKKDGVQLLLNDFIVKPNITNMNKTLITLLNLNDGASTDAQYDAVALILSDKQNAEERATTAEAALETLKKTVSESRTAEALTLVDAAIKDGRLNAEGKTGYLKLFDVDFDSAKASLSAIPTRLNLHDRIIEGGQGNDLELADLKKMSWDELDKKGKLMTLKDKYNDVFVEKFEARFGKKPE